MRDRQSSNNHLWCLFVVAANDAAALHTRVSVSACVRVRLLVFAERTVFASAHEPARAMREEHTCARARAATRGRVAA